MANQESGFWFLSSPSNGFEAVTLSGELNVPAVSMPPPVGLYFLEQAGLSTEPPGVITRRLVFTFSFFAQIACASTLRKFEEVLQIVARQPSSGLAPGSLPSIG